MTQETKSKELTFTKIKKDAKENNKTERYPLNDTTHITFYPVFPYTMLTSMFEEISEVLPSEENDVQLSNRQLLDFIMFHLIKKFTNIGKQLKAEDLSGQLTEMNSLIDEEFEGKSLFKLILDEIFLPEQVAKVQNMISESLANTEMLKRLTEQSLLQLSELDIENKEILNNLVK